MRHNIAREIIILRLIAYMKNGNMIYEKHKFIARSRVFEISLIYKMFVYRDKTKKKGVRH